MNLKQPFAFADRTVYLYAFPSLNPAKFNQIEVFFSARAKKPYDTGGKGATICRKLFLWDCIQLPNMWINAMVSGDRPSVLVAARPSISFRILHTTANGHRTAPLADPRSWFKDWGGNFNSSRLLCTGTLRGGCPRARA